MRTPETPDPALTREAPARPRRVRRAAWIALAVTLIGIVYAVRISDRMPDFEVYRRAGARVLDREPLYRAEDGHYQFKYLPAFALAAVPFGAMPQPVARATWFAASCLMLAFLLRRSTDLLPERHRTRGFLIAATFVLLAKFYAHELELGQVNILMTMLVVAAGVSLRRHAEGRAGLLIAAAVVVKPYAVLLVPYLAARRRPASVIAVAAGVAGALALPALVYGVDGNSALLRGWWQTVTETTAPNLTDFNNVSAASVFTRMLGPGPLASRLALALVVSLLAACVLVFAWRSRVAIPEPLELSLLLTMMPILSPQGWDYVFLLSTPATMMLVNCRADLPAPLRVATTAALLVIAFSLFDLMGRQAYRTFMSWSIITWSYLVVIVALVTLRYRAAA